MRFPSLSICLTGSQQSVSIKDLTEFSAVVRTLDNQAVLIGPEPLLDWWNNSESSLNDPVERITLVSADEIGKTFWTQGLSSIPAILGWWGLFACPLALLKELTFEPADVPFQIQLLSQLVGLEPEIDLRGESVPWYLSSPIPEEEASVSREFRSNLSQLSLDDLLPAISDDTEVKAVQAGILQWHDLLEASHSFSQSIEGQGDNGDYWHAIMHRREPDFGNSRYWFRRVGTHSVFPLLAEFAVDLAKGYSSDEVSGWSRNLTRSGWDSFAFVELCEEAHRLASRGTELHHYAEQLQAAEIAVLLVHSVISASGIAD